MPLFLSLERYTYRACGNVELSVLMCFDFVFSDRSTAVLTLPQELYRSHLSQLAELERQYRTTRRTGTKHVFTDHDTLIIGNCEWSPRTIPPCRRSKNSAAPLAKESEERHLLRAFWTWRSGFTTTRSKGAAPLSILDVAQRFRRHGELRKVLDPCTGQSADRLLGTTH